MIIIVAALHCEAKPLVKHFRLKKDLKIRSHQVFRSEQIHLIVSGIGKIKSATATAFMCGRLPTENIQLIINIGICGAPSDFSIGAIYLVNKIVCHSSKKALYPDILFKHRLNEAQLLTAEQPFGGNSDWAAGSSLVDLEAAGFFQAANLFVSPEKIACLKVVSDNLAPSTVTASKAEELIGDQLTSIDEVLLAYSSLPSQAQLDTF